MEKFETKDYGKEMELTSLTEETKAELNLLALELSKFDDLEDAKSAVMEVMSGRTVLNYAGVLIVNGERALDNHVEFLDLGRGSYEFQVRYKQGIKKEKRVNYCFKYDANENKYKYKDMRLGEVDGNRIDLDEETALQIMSSIYDRAVAINTKKVSNGGVHF